MFFGVILACHPDFEGRRTPLADLRGIGQGPAGLANFPQGWRPDERAVDVSTLPGGGNFCRLKVHHFDFRRVQPPVLQRAQQAVMRGGNERRGDGLADQILRFIDATAVAHHQGFGGIDLCGNEERDDRQIARGRGGQWAGAEVADLHVAGSNGGDHFRATVETPPVDFLANGFFIKAIGLGDFAWINAGLVANREVCRMGGKRKYERYTNCNKWLG
ncbi:hypothetical protein D9M71_596030 [compost metagenome]